MQSHKIDAGICGPLGMLLKARAGNHPLTIVAGGKKYSGEATFKQDDGKVELHLYTAPKKPAPKSKKKAPAKK